MKKDYYIVYGWFDQYDDKETYLWPIPWCITEDKQKAVHYFNCNTDESLCLVIIKVKLNSECLDLNKISERLEHYANRWKGNKLSWSDEQWEALTTNYNGENPEIFELCG